MLWPASGRLRLRGEDATTCGIESYACGKGRGGKDMVMINVRCMDGVDSGSFEVTKFDGRSL